MVYFTQSFLPAIPPDTIKVIDITNKNIKDIDQDCVTSNNAPNTGGPHAAIRYPIDCAIPDNSAAWVVLLVRNTKNSIDKLKANPLAVPINTHHNAIIFTLKINKPAIPIANNTHIPIASNF